MIKYLLVTLIVTALCFFGLWLSGGDFERGPGLLATFVCAIIFSLLGCAAAYKDAD